MSYWLQQAEDRDAEFRAKAISTLGKLARENETAKKAVLKALYDESSSVRVSAVNVVGHLAKSDSKYVRNLMTMLADVDRDVRISSVHALAIGPGAREACMPLCKLLEERDEALQDAVVSALESMGAEAKGALPALNTLLDARQREEREADERLQSVQKLATYYDNLDQTSDIVRRFSGKRLASPREIERMAADSQEAIQLGRQQWAEAQVRRERVELAIKKIQGAE